MSLISAGDVAAAGVLTGSSLAGCFIERRVPNTGILTTMALAALSSGWSIVPSSHPIYDLCWTVFLPISLAFLLVSCSNHQSSENEPSVSSTKRVVWDVSVPFVISSFGSIIGCVVSFLICRLFPRLWLDPTEAAVAASCLCASFIGGTVNFFATVAVIGRGRVSTLMSAMAAADTFVMAAYFAVMAMALKSQYLTATFAVGKVEGGTKTTSPSSSQYDQTCPSTTVDGQESTPTATILHNLTAATLVTALALKIVKLASRVESYLSPILPGTACATIAIISPAVQRALSKQRSTLADEMQKKARYLSEFTLQLFFAGIGKCATLGQALLHGPACLCFSLVALSIHIGLTFAGSLIAKRIFPLRFQLEEVLVASNAAIGGPATAAAFAGRMEVPRQRGLTKAGTVWGVVGYAVGTTIGVALHGMLRKCV